MSPGTWMRKQYDRPLAERERTTALVLVVGMLVCLALLLALTKPASTNSQPTPHKRYPAPSTTSPLTRQAHRTASQFLTSYLAYIYGHASANTIRGADRSLIHALESTAPALRITPTIRARHPHVLSLHRAAAGSPGETGVSALVNDGGLIDYTIELHLKTDGSQLLVSSLEGGSR